ncbi:F-box domain-containing protein [Xylariomycetidae sp. FL2044]|nr:F-box domain-containing protein [Xylariomycetidae sp. FL2044]
METASVYSQSWQTWSLDDLSTELLALIFEKLRDIDSHSLSAVCLLSRRLNAIVTPIKFETLRLNERIITPQAEVYLPHSLEKVYYYTRHVVASSELDPDRIKRILDRVRRLVSLRWQFVGDDIRSGTFWVPFDIISPKFTQASQLRLHVEGLTLRDFHQNWQDTYLRAIPANLLVSLKMGERATPLTTPLHPLKRLLLLSRQLETFHYADRGQGTRFSFEADERLPAFEELALRSYDWNHTADVVEKHWDFSQIRHLELFYVPMFPFLSSVSFSDFVHLRSLSCEDYSAHLPDRRQDATRGLYTLVRQIEALEALKITCHTRLFPIDGLLQHANSLETLRFRDHMGFGDEERRCHTIRPEDLSELSRKLTHLRDLELDMDAALCSPPLFLQALCNFERLHTLTIHTQTVLHPLEHVPGGIDKDRDAAMRTLSTLVRGKRGVSWRSITVNVGGWRRTMIRRMNEIWGERNRRGIYAERCFVLERNAKGQMMAREEMPAEG